MRKLRIRVHCIGTVLLLPNEASKVFAREDGPSIYRAYVRTTVRNVVPFVKRTTIAHHQNSEVLANFLLYEIAVRFTNVTTLQARGQYPLMHILELLVRVLFIRI